MFPVLVIFADVTGRSVQKGVITRMGLNTQAAKDVKGLIGSGRGALATLTVLGATFWSSAPSVSPPPCRAGTRGCSTFPARRPGRRSIGWAAWFIVLLGYLTVEVIIGQHTGPAGGRVLTFFCEFAVSVVFWWWSVHVLLSGRMGWRAAFPTGLVTAICLTGLTVFSALLFSRFDHLQREQLWTHRGDDGPLVLLHRAGRRPPHRGRGRPHVERTPCWRRAATRLKPFV